MEIVFFNGRASIVKLNIEVFYLAGHLLMADKVYYDSIVSSIMLFYRDIDRVSDEYIVATFAYIKKNNKSAIELAEALKDSISVLKKANSFKHKDKLMLINIAKIKRNLIMVRNEVKEEYRIIMQEYNLLSMFRFFDNDVLFLRYVDLSNLENKENELVTNLAISIINQEYTFSLTNNIETNFHFQTLSSSGAEDCDFLKIRLWKFPFIVDVPFEHHNYTREQLLPVLQPFKDKLKEIQTDFFTLEFIPENLLHFKQSIIEKINPLIMPVQQAIDESLYLSKIKNNSPANYGLTFCLGIGSAETIVDFYQKNEIVEPYEANEIKNRISRHINLKSTYIFTYFEVHD